jgi:hypothetical protein
VLPDAQKDRGLDIDLAALDDGEMTPWSTSDHVEIWSSQHRQVRHVRDGDFCRGSGHKWWRFECLVIFSLRDYSEEGCREESFRQRMFGAARQCSTDKEVKARGREGMIGGQEGMVPRVGGIPLKLAHGKPLLPPMPVGKNLAGMAAATAELPMDLAVCGGWSSVVV